MLSNSLQSNSGALHELAALMTVCLICLAGFSASQLYDPTLIATQEERLVTALTSRMVTVAARQQDGNERLLVGAEVASYFTPTANKIRADAAPLSLCIYGYLVRPAPSCGDTPTTVGMLNDTSGAGCPFAFAAAACRNAAIAAHDGSCTKRSYSAVLINDGAGRCFVSPGAAIKLVTTGY